MVDRRQYQQEFRQRQKEKLRELKETQPGRFLRNNPDYDDIMRALEEERERGEC